VQRHLGRLQGTERSDAMTPPKEKETSGTQGGIASKIAVKRLTRKKLNLTGKSVLPKDHKHDSRPRKATRKNPPRESERNKQDER